jgi:hypothetical protein
VPMVEVADRTVLEHLQEAASVPREVAERAILEATAKHLGRQHSRNG